MHGIPYKRWPKREYHMLAPFTREPRVSRPPQTLCGAEIVATRGRPDLNEPEPTGLTDVPEDATCEQCKTLLAEQEVTVE